MRLVLPLGLALALAAAAHGQNRTDNTRTAPTPTYPTPLYRMQDVSKSLNLNDRQVNRLNEMTDKLQQTYRDTYAKLADVPERDRAGRLQEVNRQYASDWMRGARDVMEEKQLARYRQLELQYGGFGSLSDPDVQKRLNLTEEQRKNLRESIDWSTQQMTDINRQGADDRDRGVRLYRDYQKAYQDRFNKYLTPEQQRAWREMTGEAYEFQPTFRSLEIRR